MIATGENLRGVSGIYAAIHRDSGMCYVGSSVNIGTRLNAHLRAAEKGSPFYFHKAIRLLGAESFDFEVLERCNTDAIRRREQFYIVLMDAASIDGFNTMTTTAATYGHAMSDATKARLSALNKGRKFTEAHKTKIRMAKRNISPETRARLSESHKNPSLELRARMSQRSKGRKHSAETKAKISAAVMGTKLSEAALKYVRSPKSAETRQRMSAAQKGHPTSDDTRRKLCLARRKRITTSETKAKMSATQKRRYALFQANPNDKKNTYFQPAEPEQPRQS